ncbi:hypothetical protein [Blastopirellula marina]|nr:hypothetical protein [Blastopirellula marina]
MRLFNGQIEEVIPDNQKKLEKKLRKQAERTIREVIGFPDEIPEANTYPIITRSKSEHAYPRQIFVSAYIESWNECLFIIGNTEAPLEGDIMTNTYRSFKNLAPAGSGVGAGFSDCQVRVIALSKLYQEDLIREIARDLYRKIPDSMYNGTTRKYKLIPSAAAALNQKPQPSPELPGTENPMAPMELP